jgi:UDP-galactopyranose mutase
MLPAATVNFPSADIKFTRVTEWAHLQGKPAPRSVLTYEIPCSEGEPFYPMPTPEAKALFKQYEALADKEPNVTFLGRLGTYQYLNMDQCVGQALAACERLLSLNTALTPSMPQ